MSKVVSVITGKTYEDSDTIYYRNAKQSAWMVNKKVELLDLIPTEDNYFIFVFRRSDHKKYISEWNATNPNRGE